MTPIVPVLVGDDWKAVFLWRALYDAGIFVNTALHPAVPPGGALLRTSVMATHDRETLDRALDAFASVKDALRGRARRAARLRARTDRVAVRPLLRTVERCLSTVRRGYPSHLGSGTSSRRIRAGTASREARFGAFGLSVPAQDSDGRKKAL